MEKHIAIIMAAGKGSRMNSDIPKQFMEIGGYPVLYYSLKVFEESFIDDIIIVTSEAYIDYCQKDIVEKYGFSKVAAVVKGGAERYDSVFRGLKAAGNMRKQEDLYVYIHDGARPFIDEEILSRARKCVQENKACTAGMPVKDTIKIADREGYAETTPDRSRVWQIQTPQVFAYKLIMKAYEKMYVDENRHGITDDAMIVERYSDHKVKLYEASYKNIKLTTPEDMITAEAWLK